MSIFDYCLLYFVSCLSQFLLLCKSGRKKGEVRYQLQNWPIDFLFRNIGISLSWPVWYVLPVWKWFVYSVLLKLWIELKKERVINKSNMRF